MYASHASLLCVLYMGVWVYGVCVVGARIYIACACARMGTAWGGVWGAYGGGGAWVCPTDRSIDRPGSRATAASVVDDFIDESITRSIE